MNSIKIHLSHNGELSKMNYQTCPHCADGADPDLARRKRVLQLLALIEHPTALPPDAALRIAQDLLAWTAPVNCTAQTAQINASYQYEHVVAAETPMEAVA
jgi:hypothetical protein